LDQKGSLFYIRLCDEHNFQASLKNDWVRFSFELEASAPLSDQSVLSCSSCLKGNDQSHFYLSR